MTRECHVRFWERVGVRLPRATRQVEVKIAGQKHWLWRAVDQNGMVLDVLILLAKSAGRLRSDQPREVRTPGARQGVAQDAANQAHKVHGGGRGDMLQVCLRLPEVARSA